MMRDNKERFGQAQAVTDSEVQSTNVYDTRNTVDRGDETMVVQFYVDTAFAGGTSLELKIMNDDAADRASEAAISSVTVALADLTAGATFNLRLPKKTLRYISANYDPTGTFTAGAISSGLIMKEQVMDATVIAELKAVDNSGR